MVGVVVDERANSGQANRRGFSMTALWAILIAGALVLGSRFGLVPDAPDAWTYDWRTALLSDRAEKPRDDIAVLLIGEESLDKYIWRSPVDRRMVAGLVTALDKAGAKAVGLDLIFDRTQGEGHDDVLISALSSAKIPVVLGVIDDRTKGVTPQHLEFQSDFVGKSGRDVGHLYFGHSPGRFTVGDQVVRYILGPATVPPQRRSFARMLAEVDGEKPALDSKLIAWLRPPGQGGTELFPTLSVVAHEPGAAAEALLPPGWESVVKDRIVLVGGSFIDRDEHLTPFSVVSGKRRPGVLIHAQILAQIRDGRNVKEMSPLVETLVLVLLAGLGVVLGTHYRWRSGSLMVWLGGLACVVLVGLASFYFFRLIVPSATFFLAWMGGVMGHDMLEAVQRRMPGTKSSGTG